MKKIVFIVLLFSCFILPVYAEENVKNNKFGIHLAVPQMDDIDRAATLVNSSGGDWGYVTLVIQENDRDHGKWQHVFDQLRKLHLIPIIRLATSPQLDVWRRPEASDTTEWVKFLNSLNWVVKDRYIILFNEANHHSEWGGEVDADNFAVTSLAFAKSLKQANADYFIMLGGLDVSAPSAMPISEDAEKFMKVVFSADRISDWNSLLSGWSSHSYPNPGFAGLPTAIGRGTVRTYDWERRLLTNFGVKDLPIFITETGWDAQVVKDSKVASYMQYAYSNIWLPDERVYAVTPFLLNYESDPFLGFSWLYRGGKEYRPVYEEINRMQKKSGDPSIVDSSSLQGSLPYELVIGSIYRFPMILRNTGQRVWRKEDSYSIRLEGLDGTYYYGSEIDGLDPLHETNAYVYAQTINDDPGQKAAEIWLYRDKEKVQLIRRWSFDILPRPSLDFEAQVFPAFLADGKNYELQIFDENQQLVYKKKDIDVKQSKGHIEQVANVLFNHLYRVVLLRPPYLPRQAYVLFKKGDNSVVFPLTVPVDFNGDGAFDANDIPALFRGNDK